MRRLTPILISHFLLNLRQAAAPAGDGADTGNFSQFTSPAFRVPTLATFVDSMAAPLDHVGTTVEFIHDTDTSQTAETEASAEIPITSPDLMVV